MAEASAAATSSILDSLEETILSDMGIAERKLQFWSSGPSWLASDSSYWPSFELKNSGIEPVTPVFSIVQEAKEPPVLNYKFSNLKLQDTRVEIGLIWNTASPTTCKEEKLNQQFFRSPNLKADLSNHFNFEFLCFRVTALCFESLSIGR
ncbi:hypothetical protein Avbf_15449 [Armadillidium vulgare]|nr:hypothetical protein Avbf_15449 [Armadillidium vulgare]